MGDLLSFTLLSAAIATGAHCFQRDDPVIDELIVQHFGGFMPKDLTDGFSSLFHDGIEVETDHRDEDFQQALIRRCEEYKHLTVALARPATHKAVALGMFEAGRARAREFTQLYGSHYHKAFNENPFAPGWLSFKRHYLLDCRWKSELKGIFRLRS